MALCSLCSRLPFTSFPRLSPTSLQAVAHDGEPIVSNEFIVAHFGSAFGSDGAAEERLPELIGFPYHENIGALAESAKACPLCAVVQAGVQEWLVSWSKATGGKNLFQSQFFWGSLPLEEKLWLTEIGPENQGFYVWASNPQSRGSSILNSNLYLLTIVGFSVEAYSPLKNQFRVRPMDHDSGSSRSLDRVALWVQNCIDHHQECSDGSDVLLPSRVLDVEAIVDTISLVDGSNMSGDSGKYACLSYCWGHSPQYTTTRVTIQGRRSGMGLNELPQTFRDAVTITRRLGLRYLWIDSLCICQDDIEDWARESGRMADVYSNAYVVIAANRSSDCTGGCFHKRAPRAEATIQIPVNGSTEYIIATRLFSSDHSGYSDDGFGKEPLSKRGWALQERTMSQRILHYNDRQMYFECMHGMEAEDGCCKNFSGGLHRQFDSPESALDVWYDLIRRFGKRRLSRATDKLPAMSGWAKILQRELQADYVAGLWSNALIQGMSWRCFRGERRPASLEEYTGPSWSWASFGGSANCSISYILPKWKVAEVLDWHVQLKQEANPFGEVRDAWIRMRGPVIGIKSSSLEKYFGAEHAFDMEAVEWNVLFLDDEGCEESREWRNWDLQAILLCGRVMEPGMLVDGLVLKGASRAGQHGKMERIGWTRVEGGKVHRILAEANWKTITLV